MLKLIFYTIVLIIWAILFRWMFFPKKVTEEKRRRRPHIRMLDREGDPIEDSRYTYIAGVPYNASCIDIGGFYGWVEAEPNNEHDSMAVAVYDFYGRRLGYIPHDELKEFRKWSNGDPLPCAGVIYKHEGKLYGKVKVLKPCNEDFLDGCFNSYINWVNDNLGPKYVPKGRHIKIYDADTISVALNN